MDEVVTIVLDIAKSVFQLHGVDAQGAVMLRKRLTRARMRAFFEKLPPCLIGMEACGSSHYWGRELRALGHDVRLIHPTYVKPYVKRQKNDAADAEAICEAVSRANMRFVEINSPEQQAIMIAHRTRSILTRQRTHCPTQSACTWRRSAWSRRRGASDWSCSPPSSPMPTMAASLFRRGHPCRFDCAAPARERAAPGLRSSHRRKRARH
ncbi:MAG: transposase [Phycisphaerales bacterium]|nr:transposase [Hyphomonadaceae bacterium]